MNMMAVTGSYWQFDDCGPMAGDRIILKDEHFENMSFNPDGLACILFPGDNVFYINRDKESRRAYFSDNGCDHFKEGLARGFVDGEMVFINKSLELALAPGFERLLPFDYGHSVVCNGPFVEEERGEHTLSRGGSCGLMDHEGNLVVEAKHKMEERTVFRDYINSHNHCSSPPVTDELSALCHAKRHVSNMRFHSDIWKRHEITRLNDSWLVSFVETNRPDVEFSMVLNSETAHWLTIIKEPHDKALQHISR